MNISVIVPTLNRLNNLTLFLRSLKEQTYLPCELIVVDQSDDTLVRDYIQSNSDGNSFLIKYLNIKEKSLTRAKNFGVDHVSDKSDLVAFFDDDIELFNDYFEQMSAFFKNDTFKHYAVATGKICSDSGRPSVASRIRSLFISFDSLLCKFFILESPGNGKFKITGSPSFYKRSVNSTSDGEVISGGVSVFRREILDKFQFDGNMKTYCYMEDVDIGYRISRKFKNAFVPAAKVYHHRSPMSRSDKTITRSQFIQNYCYLFHKNIPKNILTLAAFVWSVTGLFMIALLEFRFQSLLGYVRGLGRVVLNRYDSLYPDWKKNLVQYQ